MIKTREDVEQMMETIYFVSDSVKSFCFWIINAMSVPEPGVVHEEPGEQEYSV